MRFLIVDDDFATRILMQKLLRPFGSVDVATDGDEGVAAFTTALKENEPYSLITMDILMPHVNGQQAIREIREIEKELNIPQEKQTPIIVVSGLDDSKELHDAFFLGAATSYIIKPINHKSFIEEIEKLGLLLSKQA